MLGYTEKEMVKLFQDVLKAEKYIEDSDTRALLYRVSEVLEGLLEEGRF